MICLFREYDDQLRTKELTVLGIFVFLGIPLSSKTSIYYANKNIIETFMVFSFSIDFDLLQFKSLYLHNVKDHGAFKKLQPKSSLCIYVFFLFIYLRSFINNFF